MRLKVLGMDPSLRNWGLAEGWYDTESHQLSIQNLAVIQPVLPTGKQVRQNSEDLEAARQLAEGILPVVQAAQAIFVEVPVGSQSAMAMKGYGICLGVLGVIRALGIPLIEVTPIEVKKAATGKATATKKDMIDWATTQHPTAPWPYYKKNGELLISEANAEHMADAIGAIHAGLRSNPFQQTLPLLKAALS